MVSSSALAEVPVLTGSFTIDYNALKAATKEILTDKSTAFKGVIEVPFSEHSGPLSSMQIYLEFQNPFSKDVVSFPWEGSQDDMRIGFQNGNPLVYAEIRFNGLDNTVITQSLTRCNLMDPQPTALSLVNDGMTLLQKDLTYSTTFAYNGEAFAAKDMKLCIDFSKWDKDAADRRHISLRFKNPYKYYDICAPVIGGNVSIIPLGQEISISTGTAGATIRYTTDGSDPSFDSGSVYSESIRPSEGVNTINAISIHPKEVQSDNIPHAVARRVFFAADTYRYSEINVSELVVMPGMTDIANYIETASSNDISGLELTTRTSNLSFSFEGGAKFVNGDMPHIVLDKGATITVKNYNPVNATRALQLLGDNLKTSMTADMPQNISIMADDAMFSKKDNTYICDKGNADPITFCADESGILRNIIVAGTARPTGVSEYLADTNSTVAPRYFNLQGIPVSADRLQPGVYVMVTGNRSTKILVR